MARKRSRGNGGNCAPPEITYHFKGIRCPLCDHHFIELMHGCRYEIGGKDYWEIKCPLCGSELYAGDEDVILAEDAVGVKLKALVLE